MNSNQTEEAEIVRIDDISKATELNTTDL